MLSPWDIALQVLHIAIRRAIEDDNRRFALRIIEKVQIIAALRHVYNVLAMQGVVGDTADNKKRPPGVVAGRPRCSRRFARRLCSCGGREPTGRWMLVRESEDLLAECSAFWAVSLDSHRTSSTINVRSIMPRSQTNEYYRFMEII